MRGVHRVWAKIYDVCSHKRPRYFVLTNYNEWVFGTFSAGAVPSLRACLCSSCSTGVVEMTQAWVSPVVSWNSREPTVMEQLFFWFASAATSTQPRPLPGAWVIPQVSAEQLGNIPQSPSTFRSVCLTRDGRLDRDALRALASWP